MFGIPPQKSPTFFYNLLKKFDIINITPTGSYQKLSIKKKHSEGPREKKKFSNTENIIHALKDGSAVRAIGGYGSVIHIPDAELILLSGSCGAFCSNYDYEIAAIQRTLDALL